MCRRCSFVNNVVRRMSFEEAKERSTSKNNIQINPVIFSSSSCQIFYCLKLAQTQYMYYYKIIDAFIENRFKIIHLIYSLYRPLILKLLPRPAARAHVILMAMATEQPDHSAKEESLDSQSMHSSVSKPPSGKVI